MQDFQQRVLDERHELQAKLSKLDMFFQSDMFRSLPATEQTLLREQQLHMGRYVTVLSKRIGGWK